MTPKSEWGTPKLIVLGRGTPEEHVLAGCKYGMQAGPKNYCNKGGGCSVISAS